MIYLLKGILIGLLFGVPVGAVGTMTVQRTLKHGFRAGLATGLGSSVADCLYACIGAFGLTLISNFLLEYQKVINIIGGSFVIIMGLGLILRRKEQDVGSDAVQGSVKMFLSSFVIGITNPAAILTFLFAFTYFEIGSQIGFLGGVMLVAGVFIGTYIWWTSLSAAVSIVHRKTAGRGFPHMNKVFGTVLMLFGIAVFVRTFI